jgi:hypothetical protein
MIATRSFCDATKLGRAPETGQKPGQCDFLLPKITLLVPGAKGLGVLPHLPIFRPFFHFHKNPSISVISGTFSRENRFPPKPKKRPKIAKHTKHEPLPKRDAISLKFP